jgi:HlyD family secretion protein
MWRSRWLTLALLAGTLGGLAAWALHPTTEISVSTAPVTAGAISRLVVATGTVQPEEIVEVGAQVSGVVESLSADYNSLVHAGQVVARLDPSSYETQLREAQATRVQAQADVQGFTVAVNDAQTKLARATTLAADQLIPPSDLDAARIALDEARADLRAGEAAVVRATAAVNQAAANLAQTVIKSPIDGTVIERDVDAGQTVSASVQTPVLFRIAADLTRMQVQVAIDESDIGGVAPGEAATFQVESYPQETFHATVSQVRLEPVVQQTDASATGATAAASPSPNAGGSVVSYTAIMDVANPDERLRPGMTVVASLFRSERDHAVRIPNSALTFRPPPEVLKALGETEPPIAAAPPAGGEANQAPREVWEYDGKRFTPVPIYAGVADDGWTELKSGSIHPGDALVTSAILRRRSRL